jgi:deoxyribonuclease V
MLACLDVDYQAACVTAACVGFDAWTDPLGCLEVVVRSFEVPAPYRPGAFYERELPHLRAVLARMPVLELVLVDAYVWLGPDQPGLGHHLHDAIGVPVVGVAKTRYAGADALEVLRGDSARALYITAVGTDPAEAADHVRAMHGEHRIPNRLRIETPLAGSPEEAIVGVSSK